MASTDFHLHNAESENAGQTERERKRRGKKKTETRVQFNMENKYEMETMDTLGEHDYVNFKPKVPPPRTDIYYKDNVEEFCVEPADDKASRDKNGSTGTTGLRGIKKNKANKGTKEIGGRRHKSETEANVSNSKGSENKWIPGGESAEKTGIGHVVANVWTPDTGSNDGTTEFGANNGTPETGANDRGSGNNSRERRKHKKTAQHIEESDEGNENQGKLKKFLWILFAPFAFSSNILGGALRALLFVTAATPCIETSLSWMEGRYLPDPQGVVKSYYGWIGFWEALASFFERIVCILVMIDVKLSTDAPFGAPMKDYTFLYLFKVPPPLSRGLMLLILSGIPTPAILTAASSTRTLPTEMATISFVTNATAKFCVIPGIILIIWSIVRYRGRLFTTDVTRKDDSNKNHWNMRRYYQRDSYVLEDQRRKQRAEKIILLVVTLALMAANIAYFVLKLKNNTQQTRNLTLTFLPEWLRSSVSYISLVDDFVSQMFLTLLLAMYFCVLLIKRRYVPVHTIFKVVLVYTGVKASPSKDLLRLVNLDSTSATFDYFMWTFALIPFASLLPTLPYITTRCPCGVMKEVTGILRSVLDLVLNFIYPSKTYRLLSMMSSVLGAFAFVLILFSVIVPWTNVKFRPSDDLKPAITEVRRFVSTVDTVLSSLNSVIDPVCKNNAKNVEKDLYEAQKNLKNDKIENRDKIAEATKEFPSISDSLKQTSSGQSCQNLQTINSISCTVYKAAYVASIALMLVPFAGTAGKIMLTTARVARQVFLLLQRFIRVRDKIADIKRVLSILLKTILNDPIYVWTVRFKPEKNMMFFLLPCFAFGLFCFSLGFWRRLNSPDVTTRAIISVLATAFLILNTAMCVVSWLNVWVTERALSRLPLVDVEVENLMGWQMIKLAYIIASLSAALLWLYSSADLVISTLKALFNKLRSICKRKGDGANSKTNPRKSTMKKIISYTKKEKRKIEEERRNEKLKEHVSQDSEEDESDETKPKKISKAKNKRKKKIKNPNLLLTRVWAMPLFPAIMCAVILVYSWAAGHPAFVGDLSLRGNTVRDLTNIENRIISTIENITVLQSRDKCDPIIDLVEAGFKAATSALIKGGILNGLNTVFEQIRKAFDIVPDIKISDLNIIFISLPLLSSAMFIGGFMVTLLPIQDDKKFPILQTAERYSLMCITTAITFYMTTTESLLALISGVPLINVDVTNGPLVQMGQLASFVLLLAFIELKISQIVPISR